MQLSSLLKGIGTPEAGGGPEVEVASVCYDSRQCQKGSLFVAIPGLKADGHAFIADALERGAAVVVHEEEFHPPRGVTAVQVRDSRRALGILGKNFFADPSSALTLVAVVGTNGKTTVTYLLESILRAAGCPVGVLGTVNYRYGGKSLPAPNTTPESFEMQRILREMADHGVTHMVAEVSSHAVDLRRVDDCHFDVGVFTNLTQDHLDYHGTMENYFRAKQRFFSEVLPGSGKQRTHPMIVNIDDPWGQRILREVPGGRITYGLDNPCDVSADPFELTLGSIRATLRLHGERLEVASPLMGRFNLYNILAAAAAALALGIPGRFIQKGIAALSSVPGRLEKVSTAGQPAVFVDYAHTEDALRRVLQNLAVFRKRRIITVFGCGGDRDRGKRPLMGEAATAASDLSIVTSDNPRTEDPLEIIREIERGIRVPKLADGDLKGPESRQGYWVIPDRRSAIERAIVMAGADDIVLIAGKGHEDYQIIGTRKFPFDDRRIASEALSHWRGGECRP
jgi:UDP-N-acetylmuramoyl-L-alanyl-D-glutamate--2,6-diaminopimelate ligase